MPRPCPRGTRTRPPTHLGEEERGKEGRGEGGKEGGPAFLNREVYVSSTKSKAARWKVKISVAPIEKAIKHVPITPALATAEGSEGGGGPTLCPLPVDKPLLLGLRRGEGRGRNVILVVIVVVMTAARRMAKSIVQAPSGIVFGCATGGREERGREEEEGRGPLAYYVDVSCKEGLSGGEQH